MRPLPSGTVTFLFTDVEGSTRLLQELGPAEYDGALAEHRRVLREAFARYGGVEVDTQGDAFFYAFASATSAFAAAREGQEALESGPIRVRIGLHTGTPHVGSEGYIGEDVHLAARIAASAHGGQVVCSKETRALVDRGLTDLGEHRLKDIDRAVWLFQLGEERFPPLRTISNTNLPRPASSFVGREGGVSEVVSLLQDGARLVTLSGPGGAGKTRLAIEAAAELVPEFKNGVFWVGLAALRDPALVIETIAQTLGARDGLAEHVGERELLLLLDNFEQIVAAAPELGSLLEACPNLRLLVTSRELLRIRGEVEYAVPPLAKPEAVELFCQRSRLEPSEEISDLCGRLDNLPLAVELAAARTAVLSPQQILDRLSQRLDLLMGGRDAEARQQTLRETIEWSYDLLTGEEQRLFARLSVFAGGCALEAVEQVAEADLGTLQSLVDKSLVRHSDERFWMLETIREFGAERLEESDETEQLRRRHADYYLELFEVQGDVPRHREKLPEYIRLVRGERDNARRALDWYGETGDADRKARLAGALHPCGWRALPKAGASWTRSFSRKPCRMTCGRECFGLGGWSPPHKTTSSGGSACSRRGLRSSHTWAIGGSALKHLGV
jgi:predicted ATPase